MINKIFFSPSMRISVELRPMVRPSSPSPFSFLFSFLFSFYTSKKLRSSYQLVNFRSISPPNKNYPLKPLSLGYLVKIPHYQSALRHFVTSVTYCTSTRRTIFALYVHTREVIYFFDCKISTFVTDEVTKDSWLVYVESEYFHLDGDITCYR